MHIHNNLRCKDDNVSATIMPSADCTCGVQVSGLTAHRTFRSRHEALDACADLQHTSIEALNAIRGAISSDLQASVRIRHAYVFIR